MTIGKLEILKNRLERTSDDFRGLVFYHTMFFKHDMDGDVNYCHLPDKLARQTILLNYTEYASNLKDKRPLYAINR